MLEESGSLEIAKDDIFKKIEQFAIRLYDKSLESSIKRAVIYAIFVVMAVLSVLSIAIASISIFLLGTPSPAWVKITIMVLGALGIVTLSVMKAVADWFNRLEAAATRENKVIADEVRRRERKIKLLEKLEKTLPGSHTRIKQLKREIIEDL